MTINPDTYIKNFKHTNPNLEFCAEEDVIEALRFNVKREGIEIVSAFSTDMMPQKITMGNKPFILWDKGISFLFGRYLALLAHRVEEGERYAYAKSSADLESVLYLYLSNRFYREPLPSFLFAQMYAELGGMAPFNNRIAEKSVESRLKQAGFDIILKLGIIFVINHEFCHCLFEKDERRKAKGIRQTSDCLKSIIASKSWVDPSGDERKDYLPEYILESRDGMLQEELSCDVFAVINLTMICMKIYGIEKITAFVISCEAANLLNQFLRQLFACEEQLRLFNSFWKKRSSIQNVNEFIKEYSDPAERFKGFSERTKLACFIACMQLTQMGVLPFQFSPVGIPFVNTSKMAEEDINANLLKDINGLKYLIGFAARMGNYADSNREVLGKNDSELRLARNGLVGWI